MTKREVLSSFNSEQLDVLTGELRLTANPSGDRSLSVPSLDLLDEAKCSAYLDQLDRIFPLSKTVNIPLATLWENTAVYVYWLYEKRIGEETAEQQPRIHEDFQYLLHQAPASLFGEKENP